MTSERPDIELVIPELTIAAGPTAGLATSSVVKLQRLPQQHDKSLRAWDAADEYVLTHLAETDLKPGLRWLIVNDLFGALSVAALQSARPAELQSWGDSVISHRATEANLANNGLDPDALHIVASTEVPKGPIDVAVIKIPRSLALLEDQLRRLAPLLKPDAVVVGAGMVKAIHTSTIELFETHIGTSPTSLARKKARLILASVNPALAADDAEMEPLAYHLPNGQPAIDFANVFSRGKLDRGTGALLDHLDSTTASPIASDADIVDLGCGNGLLGLTLARRASHGTVTFVDESYQALASAKATAAAWGLELPQRFMASHNLDELSDESVDIVVNNPPFHSHQSRTGAVALAMFKQARRVLRTGGQLYVVGNRHLGYHRELKTRFAAVETVASTPKFVVLRAQA